MSTEANPTLPPITLPYVYDQDGKVDTRALPRPGDLLQVIEPGGNSALRFAKERDELVEAVDLDFSSRPNPVDVWASAGCVRYRLTSEEGAQEFPGIRSGCYLTRFALVKRKSSDDEEDNKLLEELNKLIVVQ